MTIKKGKDWVEVDATTSDLKSVDIETGPFPGFPTDMQAQFMTLNCISDGSALLQKQFLRIGFSMLQN